MRLTRPLATLAVGGALLVTAACSSGPYYGPARPSAPELAAPASNLGAYLNGDIVGGTRARTAKLRVARIAPLRGDEASGYIAREEADLRRQTVGTGVEVIRNGRDLVLRMPAALAFPVGSFVIEQRFQSTLREIAQTLKSYDQGFVDVLGHTDASGSEPANQTLSVNRAQAVANYLATRGVVRARIAVRGFGEGAPLASNDSEEGRSANRRIEIRIAPLMQPAY